MRRTEVYSINGFLNNEAPKRIEGGIPPWIDKATKIAIIFVGLATIPDVVYAATSAPTHASNAISSVFDSKIYPLFIDIGRPLAKTMMALGIYKVMRGDDKGWKTVQRAGIGLVCLYLIDGGIHILEGVGHELETA